MTNSTQRVSAYARLASARKRGEIVKPPCCARCGNRRRVSAHHEDYSRPLDVLWLCHRCHRQTHRAFRPPVGLPDRDDFIRVVESQPSIIKVADAYGVSRQTIYQWAKRHHVRFTRRIVF